ncbi:MAG TPA: rhodanese-like domain-containing protein [Polyangiaceae bacterium LLY-WYZ-14_1]|nr:rhodanese-like domain-containing protein [Polyangiaceae bacterium LLY-WYZ-14_1]
MPLSDLSNPEVLLRENWDNHLRHTADGTPVLPPSFVAEAGPRVWVIDVRDSEELTGPVGHIPSVWRMPLTRVGEIAELLPAYSPVVLVCSDGVRSTTGARYLGALGMTSVAAMNGGMQLWRQEGYAASRDGGVLDRVLERPAPGHGSDGRPLTLPKGDRRLTRDRIVAHVGDVTKLRRVKLAAFLLSSQTSCVDGREDRAIIGTPGGDAGELLLGLAAVERVTGREVDLAEIPALTRAFADTFGGIYFHTDNHALNRLTRSLGTDRRFASAVASLHTIDDWEDLLQRPPEGLRKGLLEHLVQPEHIGCGHLKLALTHPEAYGIRPALITGFFHAFFEGLWAGAPDLHQVVLGGDHSEGAVVNVTVEGTLWPFTEVPMIPPSIGGVQMFVNHPQVVAYLRDQTARFLCGRAAAHLPLAPADEEGLLRTIPELGATQALATLKALAGGLPVFDVHFAGDGTIDVTQGDDIPRA